MKQSYTFAAILCLLLVGCVNIKLNNFAVAHKQNAVYQRISQIDPDLSISGRVLVDEFAYKLPRNKKGDSVIVYAPDPTYVFYSADSLSLNGRILRDSVYLKPKGRAELNFRSNILARIGPWSMRIRDARLDTAKNSIKIRLNPWSLGIRLKKFDRFQRLKDFTDESVINIGVNFKVTINDITSMIDKTLKKKGNLGSCSKRVYWKGNTKIVSAGKNKIVFESKIQFKSYTCGKVLGKKFTAKLGSKTQTIKWDLTLSKKKNGKLNFKWNVQDVDNFPGSLEQVLRDKLLGKMSFGLPKFYAEVISVNFTKKNASSLKAECELELTAH